MMSKTTLTYNLDLHPWPTTTLTYKLDQQPWPAVLTVAVLL